MPDILKIKVNEQGYNRVFVVSDLHGCRQLLDISLQEVGFNKSKDLLVSVGDLIDRGKQNLECLELLYEPWFVAVRGNHESLLEGAILGGYDYNLWQVNGGRWIESCDMHEIALVKDICKNKIGPEDNSILPYIIIVEREGYLPNMVVHAEPPVTSYDQLYKQNFLLSPRQSETATWSRTRISYNNEAVVNGFGMVYCGHTPLKKPKQLGNVRYIDTGAVFADGYLTIEEMQWEKTQ